MKNKFLNKRKIKFLNFNIIFIFLLFIIIFFYYILNHEKVKINYYKVTQHYSTKYNFNITSFKVSNLDYIDKKIILKYFEKYRNTSIFLIPIKSIAMKMMENPGFTMLILKAIIKIH